MTKDKEKELRDKVKHLNDMVKSLSEDCKNKSDIIRSQNVVLQQQKEYSQKLLSTIEKLKKDVSEANYEKVSEVEYYTDREKTIKSRLHIIQQVVSDAITDRSY